jgi:hypothetical protein
MIDGAQSGVNSFVYSLNKLSNGTILIGGDFAVPYDHIIKWNGTNYIQMGIGIYNRVRAITVVSDTKIYICGSFSNPKYIAKWGATNCANLNYTGSNGLTVGTADTCYSMATTPATGYCIWAGHLPKPAMQHLRHISGAGTKHQLAV